MASAGDALNCTDVFARQEQHAITSSATTQWADVLARRELRATAASAPEPRRLPVTIWVDGEPIEFTYVSFGLGLPKWAESVFHSLGERWGARPQWDSYRAQPTNRRFVAKLLNILSDLMQDDAPPPQITPLTDGGVQAEWHHEGQDLEIVVPADEEPTYYYFHQQTGAEEAGDLDPNYAHVQALIGRIS